jgi:hypothetical protein
VPPIRSLAITILACAALGCGASRFPPEWLPEPQDVSRWPFGVAIEVSAGPGKSRPLKGELIAVTDDSLHVLTPEGFRSLLRNDVKEIRTRADIAGRLRSPQMTFHRDSWTITGDENRWDELRPYARYPSGMPDSVDRDSLRLPDARHSWSSR